VLGEAIWRLKLDSMVRSQYESAFAPGAEVQNLFDNPEQVVDDIDDMTFKAYKETDGEIDDYLDGGSIASRLRTTGVPVLAMDGTEDQILDSEQVLGELQAIPGARIVPVDDAGHSPNVEQPQAVADAIVPFADAGGTVEPLPKPKQPRKPAKADEKPSGKPKPKADEKSPEKAANKGDGGGK
jgi:pimeloyl-ACP methyl ester carboxylesterase